MHFMIENIVNKLSINYVGDSTKTIYVEDDGSRNLWKLQSSITKEKTRVYIQKENYPLWFPKPLYKLHCRLIGSSSLTIISHK